ncbi:hypothetical protein C2857_004319 [Epichloe festucae Fl1]|uniref:Uncharacterized protein n=1 Tax=Epichloe festucae (strain Fl1) TaxID=877507 RepID=A0A7S9KSA5_EPIFF|nr:hypothetical protein C2857_004319 [Epichloe festucae Fl1]
MPFDFGSAKTFFGAARNVSAAHPFAFAAVGAGLLVVAGPGIVAAPLLGASGFGSLGPIAGSAAACVQSGIGNVVAGSAFATLQSAGMGGAGAAVVNGVVSTVGGVVAAVGAVSTTSSKKGKDGHGHGHGAEDDGERDDGVEKA